MGRLMHFRHLSTNRGVRRTIYRVPDKSSAPSPGISFGRREWDRTTDHLRVEQVLYR